jgi:uncharacterized protein
MMKLTIPLTSLCAAMTLVACGSAPTRVYTLQPVATHGAPARYAGPPIRVAAVHLPAELDRSEIVTELDNGQLRINDLDHWAAPLSKIAQQTLSADLVARLPAGKVAFPRLPASGAAAELRVDILRVSTGSEARMQASWQLTLEHQPERSGVVDLQDTPKGAADEVATRLSTLLARLADAIAKDLAEAAPSS